MAIAGLRFSKRTRNVHLHLDGKVGVAYQATDPTKHQGVNISERFAVVGSAGLDVDLNRRFALRLLDLSVVGGGVKSSFVFQAGVVFKLANTLAKAPGIKAK